MLPQPDNILACLQRHSELDQARQFVVAFSGGLDSTVLLDLTRRALPRRPGAKLLAVHVDHHLQPSSQAWSAQCAAVARTLGVTYVCRKVRVDTGNGESPEAAARDARYRALADHIGPGDVLLCAHHRDDQIETVLLQLLRGAGVAGLAGMPELAEFAGGWYLRPLLGMTRSELLAYARHFRLEWIDDPSNTDQRYDRNFLRHQIMPHVAERWPGASASVARAAQHCAAATRLLREIGATDLAFIANTAGSVDLNRLVTLSVDRQDNALRCWLQKENLPLPSTAHLREIRKVLQSPAAAGCVSWPGAQLRRYRDRLYAMTPLSSPPANYAKQLAADMTIALPANLGRLHFALTPNGGLDRRRCGPDMTVRFRAGGEKLRPVGATHKRELRSLYQQAGIVPWMRDKIPLLYAGDRLVAVADLWLEQELSVEPGTEGLTLAWEHRPPLY